VLSVNRYLIAVFIIFVVSAQYSVAQDKEVFGWVEKVQLREAGFDMHAKLDTGADSSSVHATRLEEFTKKGEQWVRFKVRSAIGEIATIERPIERVALIKRHHGKSERRIVVRLGLCLGDVFQEEDVNLVDRTKFDYRLLLGRSFLVGNAIIDPAMMFTSPPACLPQKKEANATKDEVVVEPNKVAEPSKSGEEQYNNSSIKVDEIKKSGKSR
jgi:hypothetical protein